MKMLYAIFTFSFVLYHRKMTLLILLFAILSIAKAWNIKSVRPIELSYFINSYFKIYRLKYHTDDKPKILSFRLKSNWINALIYINIFTLLLFYGLKMK